jgi:hypothetical protein
MSEAVLTPGLPPLEKIFSQIRSVRLSQVVGNGNAFASAVPTARTRFIFGLVFANQGAGAAVVRARLQQVGGSNDDVNSTPNINLLSNASTPSNFVYGSMVPTQPCMVLEGGENLNIIVTGQTVEVTVHFWDSDTSL